MNRQVPLPTELSLLTQEELESCRGFGRLFEIRGVLYRIMLRADDTISCYIPKDKYS